MSNEIFLIMLTLTVTLTVKREQFPALIYTVFAFLTWFVGKLIEDVSNVFLMAAVSEMLLVAALFCMKGCLSSTLVKCLLPLSIVMILVHFLGWGSYQKQHSAELYNTLVDFYWGVIMVLFLLVGRINGGRVWNARFLRDANGQHNNMGTVSEK